MNTLFTHNAQGIATKRTLATLLKKHAGNKSAVARELGVSRVTLYEWLKKHETEKGGKS